MTATVSPRVQLAEIVRVELRLEARAGEAVLVVVPFGAVGLMLVPLAVGTDVPLLRQVGPGLYWVVVLLFGVLVTLRHSGVDGPDQRALLRLSGVDPVIRVLGRILASAALLLAVEILLAAVAVVLYDPDLARWPWLLPALALVPVGLAALGAVADGLVVGLAERATLGSLLVAPLALPLLLGATQLAEGARYGRQPWPWSLLVVTVDLVAVVAAVLTARSLEEGV